MLLSLSLALGISSVASLHMPFKRQAPHSTNIHFTNKLATNYDDQFGFGNVDGGLLYVAEVAIGGTTYEVQVDTGSSDLWIDTTGLDTKGFTDTGEIGSVTYGDKSSATGPILLGEVTLGDFTVKNQAFISAPGSNATASGDKGLIGIGPPGLSTIAKQLSGVKSKYNGASIMDNIFAIYPDEPNFMTFSLSRSTMGTTDGGIFTIGEVDKRYTAIQAKPKLKVPAIGNQWLFLVDSVIVNGKSYNGGGHIPATGTRTLTLLDTGTSLGTAPKLYVDAMYANLKGAKLDGDKYIVPCDSKVEITFVIGGENYPIDPIDAVIAGVNDAGEIECNGAWSISSARFVGDTILGDSFLRNVYSLFDFGNFTTVGDTPPFIQLLSTTDANKASANFAKANNARLAELKAAQNSSAKSSKASSDLADANTSNTTSSSSPQGGITSDQASTLIRNSYIVMGFLVAIVVSLLALVAASLLKGRGKSGGAVTRSAPGQFEVPFLKEQKYSTVYDHDRD